MAAVELTPAQAKALGIDVATGRARKSKAGEHLTAPHPYRCHPCGAVFPTYLSADKHLSREHAGNGRLEAVLP